MEGKSFMTLRPVVKVLKLIFLLAKVEFTLLKFFFSKKVTTTVVLLVLATMADETQVEVVAFST
jgi:hypothetical protein